jgi:uncharacterized protein YggU (UPF0235/DUF167 family)
VASVRFRVRVTPRAGIDRVDGVFDAALRCRVAAAPADGAANASVGRLLAAELRVPRSAVKIVGGATARTKTVEVDGLDRTRLLARWPDLGV